MPAKQNTKQVVKPDGCVKATMAGWKMSKKRTGRASSTPGKLKNTCKADALERFMAARGRSYKHPLYSVWCAKKDKMNGIKRATR